MPLSTCSTKRNVYGHLHVPVHSITRVFPPLCVRQSQRLPAFGVEEKKRKNKGKTQQWEAHLMWSVCKQIAIFYVNLNLSCSASYQACWQRGAYLSCWQDERGDREGEREKTCQRWLITSQANSWVLCLHLDSRARLRWASLIRIFFYFFQCTCTCAPWIISSHQLCLGFDAEDSLNYQRACSDESQ